MTDRSDTSSSTRAPRLNIEYRAAKKTARPLGAHAPFVLKHNPVTTFGHIKDVSDLNRRTGDEETPITKAVSNLNRSDIERIMRRYNALTHELAPSMSKARNGRNAKD